MSAIGSITVHVPLAVRPRPGRKTIVRPAGSAPYILSTMHADPAMVKTLARAFRRKRLLDDGRYASISDIAAAEKIDRGYVGSVLRMTLLAPDIVEAILNGHQLDGLALSDLLKPFPLEWERQRAKWFQSIERGPAPPTRVAKMMHRTISGRPFPRQYSLGWPTATQPAHRYQAGLV